MMAEPNTPIIPSKSAVKSRRAPKYQIVAYELHVLLDNPQIQGSRRSFRLKDTGYEKYGLSSRAAYHILANLREGGYLQGAENHKRKWLLGSHFKERLTGITLENKKVMYKQFVKALYEDGKFQFACAFNEYVKDKILDAFGFSEWEKRILKG